MVLPLIWYDPLACMVCTSLPSCHCSTQLCQYIFFSKLKCYIGTTEGNTNALQLRPRLWPLQRPSAAPEKPGKAIRTHRMNQHPAREEIPSAPHPSDPLPVKYDHPGSAPAGCLGRGRVDSLVVVVLHKLLKLLYVAHGHQVLLHMWQRQQVICWEGV